MTDKIEDLERQLAEANAKVAEAAARHWSPSKPAPIGALDIALLERHSILAALDPARQPKLLTAEEAWLIFAPICNKSNPPRNIGPVAEAAMQAVLAAAHARALKVIEALPKLQAGSLILVECRSLHDISRVLTEPVR